MAKGRPPKPTEVKRAEGNAGHRPLPDTVLVAGRGMPDKPVGLSETAAKLWDVEVPKMAHAGMLDLADGPVLGQYFEAWALAIAAANAVDADPVTMEPNDFTGEMKLKKHPGVTAWKDAVAIMRQLGEQYGLTPSARARLGMAKVPGANPAELPDVPGPAPLKAIDGGK